VPLQKSLVPTSYVPPTPKPKPRIKTRAPVALPRNRLRQNQPPKKIREKVQKLIDEITP